MGKRPWLDKIMNVTIRWTAPLIEFPWYPGSEIERCKCEKSLPGFSSSQLGYENLPVKDPYPSTGFPDLD